MAYSDFTALDLTRKFGVKFRAEVLFPDLQPLKPSQWLIESLERGQNLGFGSEKSRSERLVTPILLELSYLHKHQFSIHSGMSLDIDEASGLKGECDFIFSYSRIQDFVTAPVFCITEAKKQDLEQGTIQCAAQLIGAKKFNELENNDIEVIYGASTTGIEWRFMRFENNEIIIDEARYLISNLEGLLGVFESVIRETSKTS
ncbi:MAG: hypothetical protein MUE85_07205 [Microscillaceae bacterium]|jgi:hypothetical protein|nr:hypothetical protein [Microscillaceae bacterium]